MEKRGRYLFLKVFIIMLIVTIWIALIAYEQLPYILKPEISQKIKDFYNQNPRVVSILFNLRGILISLIPLTILFLFIKIFVLVKDIDIRKIDIKKYREKSKTDIDALYEILKEFKQIKISSIPKIFKVKKEIAMEWAKILESSDLAYIEYPNLGEPCLKIKEEKKEQEEIEEEVEEEKDSTTEKKEDKKEEKIIKKIKKQQKKDEKLYNKALKKAYKKIKKEAKR